jgi:Spy/CpxP family protein refolding chaperone
MRKLGWDYKETLRPVTLQRTAHPVVLHGKEIQSMKKRIKILSLAVVAAGALALTPMVLGAPSGGHMSHMGGHMGGHGMGHGGGFGEGFLLGGLAHIQDELDLTDAQTDQIRTIVTELQEQNAPYREQMHEGMKDAAKVLIANPNDVAGAQAALDAQTVTENAMKSNALQATSKALNVLTPEQRTKLGTLLEQHHERMKSFSR